MAKAVLYSGNIWIWKASRAYRLEVEKVLTRMLTTQSGKDLVKHIKSRPKWMMISPFVPSKKDRLNAYAAPRDSHDSLTAGYVGNTIELDLPYIGKIVVPSLIGTGKGSRVDIIYHPASWHQLNKNMGHIAPGSGPAEIMFHEMIHGLRQQSGLMRHRDLVAENERMDNVEEFYAIMAANVYRSERGFTKLRADHWGFTAVNGSLSGQTAYYQHYKSYIDKWFQEQRTFCLDMARAPAKFNPFREAAVELKLMTGPTVSMRL